MPRAYRRKIKTYVTIGSVLGLYNVIAPIPDETPLPDRFRKTDYKVETFAPGFRWFNCWNLADNITSFYGLDAYDLLLHQGGDNAGAERLPTNIRTRTRGHSEYWTNLEEVLVPFARRVIEDKIDEMWQLEPTHRTRRHVVGEALSWLLLVAGVVSLALLFSRQLVDLLFQPLDLSLWALLGQVAGLLAEVDFLQPFMAALADGLEPIGAILNDDVQRISWIMAILIAFSLLQIVRSIAVWRGSKAPPSQEA
jgi:hypothetical protein